MYSKSALAAVWLVSLVGVNAAPSAQVGKCQGQSCYVALLSGSTGEPYKQQGRSKPAGGNASGDRCIKNAYKSLGLPPPEGLRFVLDNVDLSAAAAPSSLSALEAEAQKAKERRTIVEAELEDVDDGVDSTELDKRQLGGCKANTLLFGKGTTEMGSLGATVGPAFGAKLTGWDVVGINYPASLAGIYCLGMDGGVSCVKQINSLSAKCPNTKIVLSGYSQGAMVARICAAFANEKARSQIAGLVTFGDPFNGAKVKGFPDSKVGVFCNTNDAVCKGEFTIGAGHLSYGTKIGEAAKFARDLVAG